MRRGTRSDGTNPRALGVNARALSVNPRALGVNPKALGVSPHLTAAMSAEMLTGLKNAIRDTVRSYAVER